jgi:hypothetical protein
MRRWIKLGQLFTPREQPQHPKLITHAANPTPVHLREDTYRIFYSARDEANRSSVGAVDVDISQGKVIVEHRDPFFLHGPRDSFYSDGVSLGNCYVAAGRKYMSFMGWHRPSLGHWRGEIGRLILTQGVGIELDSGTPLLKIDSEDPVSLSYPWIHSRPEGGFDMWYGSTLKWDGGNGEMVHVVKHAFSDDGESWRRTGYALSDGVGLLQATSRPSVHMNGRGYFEMWFSFRGAANRNYRIGYGRSDDGVKWRLDLTGSDIDVSLDGWDSEMIEYPYVFTHAGATYMLYNGNQFGKTGFGLAVRDVD